MTLDALVMLSGALVAFLSVAGFPPSVYKPLFFILGLVVIGLGIVVRRKRGEWETTMRKQANALGGAAAPAPTHEETRSVV
jgi:hypothetical protein